MASDRLNALHYMRENDPTLHKSLQTHQMPSQEKKLCVVWPDGEMASLLYTHLVSSRLRHQDDLMLLTVKFFKEQLLLKGYNLATLFWRFHFDYPAMLEVTPDRYADHEQSDKFVITEAMIEE